LRDVEKVVDWVICLDHGKVVTDAALDELKEHYSEWQVISNNGDLPQRFSEPFVLEQEISGRQARLIVERGSTEEAAFRAAHNVEVSPRPLNLEEMFPVLIGRRTS
jgi:ABC-type multidrug transport system ATPase subunit